MAIRSVGRAVLMSLFWVWGALGLIGNLLSLDSAIGVATLSSQLLWIGGILLFGLGALLLRPAVPAVPAEHTMKHEGTVKEPLREAIDSDREKKRSALHAETGNNGWLENWAG
jgi:hypothetical protein